MGTGDTGMGTGDTGRGSGDTGREAVRLSPRLTAIADMVSRGTTICDVGCDHAHIPIYLLQEGRIRGALGMDVIPGPLQKARENLERYGYGSLTALRMSDGLDAYVPGEAESLVIAGMGGRIMRKILLREPGKTKSFRELILQPQADPEQVRMALQELGFVIDGERMLRERNKYYVVMHAVPAVPAAEGDPACGMTEAELRFGPVLLRRRAPVLKSFLQWRLSVQDRILASVAAGGADAAKNGAAQSESAQNEAALSALEEAARKAEAGKALILEALRVYEG